jgi:hypothetical protein
MESVSMSRGSAVLLVALSVLLSWAVWFRLARLGTFPEVDGDESWHALQVSRLLRGEPYALWTYTNLPLSPYHVALELPGLLLAPRADFWVLRVPCAVSGLLALGLMGFVARRMFDGLTAAIATGLLAVLPVAIIYARTGYEGSHTPAYTLLLIYLAHRLKIWAVAGLLLTVYFVHPTNLFVVPTVLALIAARSIRRSREEGRPVLRTLAWRLALPLASALAMGLLTVRWSTASVADAGLRGAHDPWLFLRRLGHLFLGLEDTAPRTLDWAFWSVVGVVGCLGAIRLVRSRRWEPLALIGGTVLGALALFVVGGSNSIQPGVTRYGLSLVTPSVLGFACLVRTLVVPPKGRGLGTLRFAQLASLLVLGGAILGTCRPEWITPAHVLRSADGSATLPHPRFDPARHPARRALEQICRDLESEAAGSSDGSGQPGRRVVKIETPSLSMAMGYLATDHPELDVRDFRLATAETPAWSQDLVATLLEGGYAVGGPDGPVARIVESAFPRSWLRRRDFENYFGLSVVLYDLRRDLAGELPLAADYDGDGRDDMALYRAETMGWEIRLSGGGQVVRGGGSAALARPVVADFDGDGRADPSLYLPARSVADLNGDGRAEPLGFVSSVSTWFLPDSSVLQFGQGRCFEGDPIPVPADYDGDGRDDLAVFDAKSASWLVSQSRDGGRAERFGAAGGVPVPADYDGDGKADLATYDPETGDWVVRQSSAGPRRERLAAGGVPLPADYDGDGRSDLAVFEPGTGRWSARGSLGGELVAEFGTNRRLGGLARRLTGESESSTR